MIRCNYVQSGPAMAAAAAGGRDVSSGLGVRHHDAIAGVAAAASADRADQR